MEKQSRSRYNIRVLDRAFRIFSLLSDGKPHTLTEISEEIELSPSTTFRLLSTLAYYNYVKKVENTNQYQLGLACLELAFAYQVSNNLRQVALPLLESLRDEVKETVHLSVLDKMEVVYIEKLPGLHAVGIMSSRVGGRAPSYCTGVGKVLLAFEKSDVVLQYFSNHCLVPYTENTITDINKLMGELEIIRQRGYSFDRGEHEHEVRCIAAPIFDISGKAVAALSVAGPDVRMEPLEKNEEIIQKVLKTAFEISHQLGYHPDKSKKES